jgi:hypothetical protein
MGVKDRDWYWRKHDELTRSGGLRGLWRRFLALFRR